MKSPDDDAQPPDVSASTEPLGDRVQAGTAARGDGVAIHSESLLRGRNEVQILHRGVLYRLCLTRAGKIILQK
jgi:hemin uptake protein HemP